MEADTDGAHDTGGQSVALVAPRDRDAEDARRRLAEARKTYARGRRISTKGIKDKKLRGKLKALEARYQDATLKAKDAEILLENESGFLEPEGELERTHRVRQDEIKRDVAIETAKKGFELKLDALGPYVGEYTRNGRGLLLAGRKGHVATMDWRAGRLTTELQLGETVRDARWLHNDQYVAVAQKKYVYIYDHAGVELHCLKKHIDVTHLEFLPYHFLLASIGHAGYLKYTDTSTGQMVTELPTRLGTPTALGQNPRNAILHVGHQNGCVTLWSPNSTTPLVKMLAHRGPVRALAIDREGRYMVSTGQDLKMAVWDVRTFKEVSVSRLHAPGASVAISDRNLTAVGWGTQVTVWKDVFSRGHTSSDSAGAESAHTRPDTLPYLSWQSSARAIERVRWCPFEDVLGVTHAAGFTSLIVPGAGEANFDALEANPYEDSKQRQNAEVRALLNKLQPEMISLDPDYIGKLDLSSAAQRKKAEAEAKAERAGAGADADPAAALKVKNRGRGKNSSLRTYLRKRGARNVVDEKRLRVEALRKDQARKERTKLKAKETELGPALARFAKKGAGGGGL